MPFLGNAGKPASLARGYVDGQLSPLNKLTVVINPSSVSTFAYGDAVKIIGSTPGGMPIVDAITATTDYVSGFITANQYLPQSTLVPNAPCDILQKGLDAVIVLNATTNITNGTAIYWDYTNGGIANATGAGVVTSPVGYAKDTATTGGFLRIFVDTPKF